MPTAIHAPGEHPDELEAAAGLHERLTSLEGVLDLLIIDCTGGPLPQMLPVVDALRTARRRLGAVIEAMEPRSG